MPGMTSTDHAELVAARKRIAELEVELAIHRRAAGCSAMRCPQKAVWGDRGNRREGAAGAAGRPGRWRCRNRHIASGAAGRPQRARCGMRS
jgi:hypothetical protein